MLRLQTELTDRNRRDSLQLLRIQNDLNQLGLAMRDMLDPEPRYPLAAWSVQFTRIREDLESALRVQADVGAAQSTSAQKEALTSGLSQFWDAADRMFEAASNGRESEARSQIRVTLQARQESLTTSVARLLARNNAVEEQTARDVQAIYQDVQRQVIWFLAATLAAIIATSLYLIRSNRRLFARLALLSDERQELARTLIATRESTLHEIARELHDNLGQLLTAMGSMLGRTSGRLPPDATVRTDLQEIREVAQTALDNVRGLSQTLHPSVLEEVGLDSAIASYVASVERQLGIRVHYERQGDEVPVDDTTAIHVYRVLQEAISNVARHSGAREAHVRLRFERGAITLDVEDRGTGLSSSEDRPGLGLVAMRERAGLLGGSLTLLRPPDGGTLVRLTVPPKAT